ncbi:hypothetical protein C8Q80DRAFT_1274871 [Daedaleopsis nitida]|nr:hypothetical protein C8Q80DRAFT_1274871 [Daedaleopsis nitida]
MRLTLSVCFNKAIALFRQASEATTLSIDEVLLEWKDLQDNHFVGSSSVALNPWNAYEGFYAENFEEEIRRVLPNFQADCSINQQTTYESHRRRCYEEFMRHYGESAKGILATWHAIHVIDRGATTVGQRIKNFHKFKNSLSTLITRNASLYGFETTALISGNLVADAGMKAIVNSKYGQEFFSSTYETDDESMLNRFQQHVSGAYLATAGVDEDSDDPIDGQDMEDDVDCPASAPDNRLLLGKQKRLRAVRNLWEVYLRGKAFGSSGQIDSPLKTRNV